MTVRHPVGTSHHWLAVLIADWCVDNGLCDKMSDPLLYPSHIIDQHRTSFYASVDDLVDKIVARQIDAASLVADLLKAIESARVCHGHGDYGDALSYDERLRARAKSFVRGL